MIFNMKVRVYHLNLIINVQFKLQDNWSQNPLKMECFHYIGLMALDSTLKCTFSFHSNCQTNV